MINYSSKSYGSYASLTKGNYFLSVGYGYSPIAVSYTIYRLDNMGVISYRIADIVGRQRAITLLQVAIAQSW